MSIRQRERLGEGGDEQQPDRQHGLPWGVGEQGASQRGGAVERPRREARRPGTTHDLVAQTFGDRTVASCSHECLLDRDGIHRDRSNPDGRGGRLRGRGVNPADDLRNVARRPLRAARIDPLRRERNAEILAGPKPAGLEPRAHHLLEGAPIAS